MNAIIQMFYSIPEFRDLTSKLDLSKKFKPPCDKQKILTDSFKRIFSKYTEISNNPVQTPLNIEKDIFPQNAYSNIFLSCPQFKKGKQEDARELYTFIIDAYTCYDEKYKNLDFMKFNEENILNCIDGKTINLQTFPQYILSVGISEPSINDIQTAINNYISSEYLTPGNDYLEACGIDPVKAKNSNYKKINVKLLPTTTTLIINLKRFEFTLYGTVKKNSKTIIPNKELVVDGQTFILKGCVIHSGALSNAGHYVFISYDDDGNYEFLANDPSIVSLNKFPSMAYNDTQNGYIFYYKKKYKTGGNLSYQQKYLKYKAKYLELMNS